MLAIVTKIVIPLLPFFIAFTFCSLSYEGSITKQLPVFIQVIVIVMVGHYIWMALLYGLAGIYTGKNPFDIIKNTARPTSRPSVRCPPPRRSPSRCAARRSLSAAPRRHGRLRNPALANIHLCGSVLTEVFFVMTISKILYGAIPPIETMVLFCLLLGTSLRQRRRTESLPEGGSKRRRRATTASSARSLTFSASIPKAPASHSSTRKAWSS